MSRPFLTTTLCLATLITACSGNGSGAGPTVASIDVAPSSTTILAGHTAQLTATPRDASGDPVTGATVTWTSANTAVATVSSGGLVTGVSAGGPVTITASNGGVTGHASITISAPVASVAVTPPTPSIAAGGTVQLSATPEDADGGMLTGRSVTWTSSDNSVATVSSSGLVTGVAAGGPATITATSEGVNGTASVTVTPPPVATVTVAPPSPSVVVGTTVQLTATVKDAGGNTLVGRAVTWGTSNGAIATVSGSGLVTAVAVGGPVTITATSEGVNGTAAVAVVPVPVATVTVTPGTPGTWLGATVQLTASLKDASGNALVGRTVTWATGNSAIATVSSSGLVTTVAVGGPVTITATSEGVNGTATVTVIPAQTIYWTMFSASAAIPQIQAAALPLTGASTLTNVPLSANLRETAGMTFDASGRLWVVSYPTDDHPVAAVFLPPITAASVPALIFPLPATHDIDFLSFDHAGNLWASDYTNAREYMFPGPFTTAMTLVPTVTLSLPGFTNPTGNAVDAAGNVYVPNLGSHGTNSIAVFTAPVTSASTPAFFLNGLRFPGSLIFDAQGNLYASDNPQGSQSAIVRYNSNNLVSGAMPNVVDPTGLGTQNYGTAFAFDGLGNLYVADCGNAGSAGVRTYLTGTNPFTATLAPSSTFTDVPINSLGCVWGIAIH